MSRIVSMLVAIAFLTPLVPPSVFAADGKELFTKLKCNGCHNVSVDKIEKTVSKKTGKPKKGPDLSGVGLEHDAAWVVKWLKKEEKKESLYKKGKEVKHKKKFKGTEDELKQIASYLESKKTKVEQAIEEGDEAEEEDED